MLASFGTTVPSAVKAITNIQEKVKAAFPGIPVRLTFASNIIRSVWKERRTDPKKLLDQGIPKDVLYVKNIIATIGYLREAGYDDIIVQPTHIFFMEQSYDLSAYVNALASIRTMKRKWQPFHKLVMGRPALIMPGDRYDYHVDMKKALKTVAADVELAKKNKTMLVCTGHGNEHWSVGIYGEAANMMRDLYPGVITHIGCVEGFPGIKEISRDLDHFDRGKLS